MGWIANFFLIYGTWLIARKIRLGLLVCVLGGLLWAYRAVVTNQPDLFVIEIILSCIQVYGWFKWKTFTNK